MRPPRRRISAPVIVAAALVAACSPRQMSHSTWTVRFGPVIGDELIVGRAYAEDEVWLATSLDALVRVRLRDRSFQRAAIRPREPSEHAWGLALADGRLWTLLGRGALAEVAADGTIVERIPLAAPHVGLFSGHGRLLYQLMNFSPPTDALHAGAPGETDRRPWGGITTRALALERGAVAALNLLSCGAGTGKEIACWFPDEAAVHLVERNGRSRRLDLEGLPLVPPEVLLASESPRKPIRDAFVAASGELWVLSTGRVPEGSPPRRTGGWLLATYAPTGEITRRLDLPEPARLVMSANESACLLLAWNGSVVEVRP